MTKHTGVGQVGNPDESEETSGTQPTADNSYLFSTSTNTANSGSVLTLEKLEEQIAYIQSDEYQELIGKEQQRIFEIGAFISAGVEAGYLTEAEGRSFQEQLTEVIRSLHGYTKNSD